MKSLLFITSHEDRTALVASIRRDLATVVGTFGDTSPARQKAAWEALLKAGHEGGPREVRLTSVECIPGGVWSWVRDLSTLGDLGISLRSEAQPWLVLDEGQVRLLRFLRKAHDDQRRERIRDSLRNAKGKVGRPRATVDVKAMAVYRDTHSLRETARQFGIGASTCHRILAAYAETQRTADPQKGRLLGDEN